MGAGNVVVVIPTLNEQDSIAEVARAIPRPPVDRIVVADGPSTDATAARAAEAGAEVIKVGRGYGPPAQRRLKPRRTPRSSCSWMAMVPTIRRAFPT